MKTIPRAQKTLGISVYTNQVIINYLPKQNKTKYTDTRYTTNIPTPLPTKKYTNNI